MNGEDRDPAAGAAVGAISAAKNRKLTAAIGGAHIVVGIVGMIIVGSGAIDSMLSGGFSSQSEGSSFQIREYVFLFMIVGGLVVLIYSFVAYQSKQTKIRESRRSNFKSDADANAA